MALESRRDASTAVPGWLCPSVASVISCFLLGHHGRCRQMPRALWGGLRDWSLCLDISQPCLCLGLSVVSERGGIRGTGVGTGAAVVTLGHRGLPHGSLVLREELLCQRFSSLDVRSTLSVALSLTPALRGLCVCSRFPRAAVVACHRGEGPQGLFFVLVPQLCLRPELCAHRGRGLPGVLSPWLQGACSGFGPGRLPAPPAGVCPHPRGLLRFSQLDFKRLLRASQETWK